MPEEILIKTVQEWGGTYDEIHSVIYQAHEQNRKKGLVYQSSLLDGDRIKQRVGNGVTYVAISDGKVVGTGSISLRKGKYWFDKGVLVAHYCLSAVLPEYQGRGIMKEIFRELEQFAVLSGAKLIRSGTAEKNIIQRHIFKQLGFSPVDYIVTKGNGYYSIMYAKWLDKSVSPGKWKRMIKFLKSKIRIHLMYKANSEKSFIGRMLSDNILNTIKTLLKQSSFYRFYLLRTKRNSSNITSSFSETPPPSVIKKMKQAYIRYDISGKDFYQCRCDLMPLNKIREVVPYKKQRAFYKRVNSERVHDLLCDKYLCYKYFKPYYKRDVILVNSNNIKAFEEFCSNHSSFISKPLTMNCGRGIQIIKQAEEKVSIEQLFSYYPNGFIAEELIIQNQALANFHPSSVNTLRINTVNYGNSVEIKWPCLRIGCGNSIVDNAGAGGIFGAIDVKTGKIIAVSDEFHHTFTKHPDSGIQIVGYEIPQWKDACEMAIQLASVIPEGCFIGWDLALTDNGWVMVEGNYSPLLIWQIAAGKGVREEFEQMLAKLKGRYE